MTVNAALVKNGVIVNVAVVDDLAAPDVAWMHTEFDEAVDVTTLPAVAGPGLPHPWIGWARPAPGQAFAPPPTLGWAHAPGAPRGTLIYTDFAAAAPASVTFTVAGTPTADSPVALKNGVATHAMAPPTTDTAATAGQLAITIPAGD